MKSSFIVDEKRITEIKWRTPFRALYQPKDGSGLPPYGAGYRTGLEPLAQP